MEEFLRFVQRLMRTREIDAYDLVIPEEVFQEFQEFQEYQKYLEECPEHMDSREIALLSVKRKDREKKEVSLARLSGDYKMLCDEIVTLRGQIQALEEKISVINVSNSTELLMREDLINSIYNFVKDRVSNIPSVKYVFVLETKYMVTFSFIVAKDTFLKSTEELSVVLVDILRTFDGIDIDFATFEEQQVDLEYLMENNKLIYPYGEQ